MELKESPDEEETSKDKKSGSPESDPEEYLDGSEMIVEIIDGFTKLLE